MTSLLTASANQDYADFVMDDQNDYTEFKQFRNTIATPPFDIVTILTDPSIGLQNILPCYFYLKTNSVVTRSVLDLPLFQPQHFSNCPDHHWHVDIQAFFTQMRHNHFTNNACGSERICSVTALQNSAFLDRINNIELLPEGMDIPDMLEPFTNITLEERRLGCNLHASAEWRKWFFSATLPVLYQEYNFFLSEDDRIKLQESPMFSGTAESGNVPVTKYWPKEDLKLFFIKHLLTDYLGLDDLRIRAYYKAKEWHNGFCKLGLELTVPSAIDFNTRTAYHITKNIGGAEDIQTLQPDTPFSLCRNVPPFSFAGFWPYIDQIIADPDHSQNAQKQLTLIFYNFGIGALDRLTATFANKQLGAQNFCINPAFMLEQYIGNRYTLLVRGGVGFYTPHHTTRPLLPIKTCAEFLDRDYANSNPVIAQNNLDFLNQQTIEMLYPPIYHITSIQGIKAQITPELEGLYGSWTLRAGYDFWIQGKEYISGIPDGFIKDIARQPQAHQSRIFGHIDHRSTFHSCFWHLGFGIDSTIESKGIGKEWAAELTCALQF